MDYKLDEYNSLEDGPHLPARNSSNSDNTTFFGDISAFDQESHTNQGFIEKNSEDLDLCEIKKLLE